MPFKYNVYTSRLDFYEDTTLPSVPEVQVFFSTDLPTDVGVVFTPNTPALVNTLYISGTTSQVYTYFDGIYSTYVSPIPNNTAWYIKGTSLDAGGSKTASISRTGDVTTLGNFSLGTNAKYLYGKNSSGVSTRMIGINGSNAFYIGSVDANISAINFNINGNNILNVDNTGVITTKNYTLPLAAPTVDQVLGYSSPGVAAWITGSGSLAGNVLFVSSAGSDTDVTRAGHLGDTKKPFRTLQAARNAAISGDLIYVFPQYFIFDNSAGIYDSNLNDLNLWKNGVTYYWSPGCKLKFMSCIANAASKMRLFRPSELVYETCTSVGYLEYEQYSTVPSNGQCQYFDYDGTSTGVDYGFKFFSQTKSQIGYGSTLIGLVRGNSTSTSAIIDVTIISDYEENVWINGHSGGAFTYGLFGSTASDVPTRFRSYVKNRVNSNNSFLTVRDKWGPTSTLEFYGDTFKQDGYASSNRFIEPRITSTLNLDFDIKKMYYSTVHVNTTNACVISDNLNPSSLGTTINMKGDLIASTANGNAVPLFSLFYNTTINYNGNIYTNTSANAGNTIATANSANSKINIGGNVNYIGSSVTTNGTFKTSVGGLLKFNGNISGNFAGAIAQCGTGTIEINNSNIKSTVAGAGSYFFLNGGTSLGTVKINNSYIELNNSTNPTANGAYVKALINNSTLISSGASAGIANSTNFGSLQAVNSMIYATSSPVNYTGTAAVTVASTSTNTAWTVATPILGGTLDIIPSLTF